MMFIIIIAYFSELRLIMMQIYVNHIASTFCVIKSVEQFFCFFFPSPDKQNCNKPIAVQQTHSMCVQLFVVRACQRRWRQCFSDWFLMLVPWDVFMVMHFKLIKIDGVVNHACPLGCMHSPGRVVQAEQSAEWTPFGSYCVLAGRRRFLSDRWNV